MLSPLVSCSLLTFLSPSGGATATAPAAGFNNSDLSVYFTKHASVASRTPTRSLPTPTNTQSSKSLPTGAIAGIAVGGAIVLVALIIGLCCFCRCHRKQRAELASTPAMANTGFPQPPQSPHSHYTHQYYEPRYQLAANSPPAELSDNNIQMHQVDPKNSYQVDENQHPIYTGWNQQQPSPTVASPHPSAYSGVTELSGSHSNTYFGSQTSPAPTYSSAGRSSRKPVPHNQTYYSP